MNSVKSATPPYILLLILLGFLAMFAAFFYGFIHGPADKRPTPGAAAPAPEPTLSEEQTEALNALMNTLKSNPDDADALMEIGGIFLAAKDWARAEIFLNRAVANRPTDTDSRYMLAIALYQQERIQEAATAFEELLSMKKNAAAQFNLAVIYKYHLDKPDEARALFKQIAASPDADIAERARKELEVK